MTDLAGENAALRERVAWFLDRATANEAILRRFQAYELTLLGAATLPEIFQLLGEGLKGAFSVERTALRLIDPHREVRRLLTMNPHSPGTPAWVFLEDGWGDVPEAFRRAETPLLSACSPATHGSLFPGDDPPATAAVLPLRSQGCLFGLLALGSRDPARFTGERGVDFLAHLACVAAVCLENVINRERLALAGLTDILTGVHNRRYLERRLAEELARSKRHHEPLSCLFLDLDHFKQVNDTYGHGGGDRVLREVALSVRASLRGSDVLARYGGEEFAVLLPDTGLVPATRLAERIRRALAARPVLLEDGREVGITVSVGVSTVRPGESETPVQELGRALLAEADANLYKAKAAGRNRVVAGAGARVLGVALHRFLG